MFKLTLDYKKNWSYVHRTYNLQVGYLNRYSTTYNITAQMWILKIQIFIQTLVIGQTGFTWRNANSTNRKESQLNGIFMNLIPFLQVNPSYPGSHPWSQLPVIWWHVVLFKHFPQVVLQFFPWNPAMHSIVKKTRKV